MQFLFNHRIINLGKIIFLFFLLKIFFLFSKRYLLSLSMEARGEYEQSVDVGATAVHLEEDSPIVSYHSIIRVL
jgi:hypothetical protein